MQKSMKKDYVIPIIDTVNKRKTRNAEGDMTRILLPQNKSL